MSKTFDSDALIDACLPLIGAELSADSRAAVKAHLEIAEKLARLVVEFPLDDEAEPAPVYAP